MTVTITLELPYPPTGNHATKHTRTGGHYKTAESVAYRALVLRTLAGVGMGCLTQTKPLTGPLSVEWLIAPPDRRARDVDNVRKEAADALTKAGMWADDSNKVIRRERFEWAEPTPGGELTVTISGLA